MSDRPDPIGVLAVHTATLPPLGADTWVHAQILRGLDRSTHRVHVAYADRRDGRPTPTAEILDRMPDFERHHVSLGREVQSEADRTGPLGRLGDAWAAARSFARLVRVVRTNDIRIIHTSDRPRDAVVAVALARLTGARSIIHLHVLLRAWQGRALRWAIERADARIAVSAFVAQSLTDAGLGPNHVVLNAIDNAEWTPGHGRDEIRAELGLAPDAPVVVTACRLFPEKGVAELIEAMAEVVATVPAARLVVVGRDVSADGSFGRQLEDLVEARGLTDHVIFTGQRPDVPELMAAADVFAMPSFEEPFGLVFVEAMAMGLPVVALDNGGTREIVVDGQHGLLSEPGDHAALVDHLGRLLADAELRDKLGSAGRERALADFDVARMAEDTAATYRRVLADGR